MTKRLNVAAMLDTLGSPELLSSALELEGLAKIDPVAVHRWKQRNSIPAERLVALMALARRKKLKFDPTDFYATA